MWRKEALLAPVSFCSCAAPLALCNVAVQIGTREVWDSAPSDLKEIFSSRDRNLASAQASGRARLKSHNFICCSHVCPFYAISDRFLKGAELF